MMDRIAGNGVRTILVESPDRFARDLAVQLAGHSFLKGMGVALVPATAPDYFLEDTPTAVLVRQVLELSRNLGDENRLKAAYRGGCRALPEPPERSNTPCREIPQSFLSVSLMLSKIP
jgi:hypothetical protein